jgi:phosphoglycerate dehydrogenase-like enzyme
MTFAFMLGLARRIYEADRLWRSGHWAKQSLEGYLLRGKTLGVVGVGNIGSRVGQLGSSFNMNVIGCVEYSSLRLEQAMARAGIRLTSFDEVVSSADFLSINVPLNDSTRNLIDAEVLKRMKPGAFLVNTARGGIVDELALYDQLLPGGRLRGAALDVHEHEGEGQISPLAALPNVLLTPHIAAMTVDTQREIGRRAVEIIADFAKKHDSDSLTSSLRVEEFSICETD